MNTRHLECDEFVQTKQLDGCSNVRQAWWCTECSLHQPVQAKSKPTLLDTCSSEQVSCCNRAAAAAAAAAPALMPVNGTNHDVGMQEGGHTKKSTAEAAGPIATAATVVLYSRLYSFARDPAGHMFEGQHPVLGTDASASRLAAPGLIRCWTKHHYTAHGGTV